MHLFSKYHSFLLFFFVVSTACNAQNKQLLGGPCEGCEAIYEYGNRVLTATDTLPKFQSSESKMKISGTVYQKDGKTPAGNVILYIYHTNREGIYETRGGEKGWAKLHGYIRGWIKTGADGRYTFYTFKPATYPDRSEPAHIHITVKEPGKKEYYLDDFIFEDDPLFTPSKRAKQHQRGGSGIMKPALRDGILEVQRDLVLGLNIPHYE